jgi:DNA-binding transcriptional MerR regulator
MLINELSKQTGFSIDTIRFYEKIGLLDDTGLIRRANRYKDYTEKQVQKLLVIRDLKDFGFTLKEIKEIISLYKEDSLSCVKNVPKIQQKISFLSSTIHRLTSIQERLTDMKNDCAKDCQNCCGLNKSLRTLNGVK